MILKEADDKSMHIHQLEQLLKHPAANTETKKKIEQEIRNIRAGMKGEAEAAYEMKVWLGESKNWLIIHDLRIEHNGLVAQIDHLLLNRALMFWFCESKHFSEGVAINEHGEFAAFYGSKPYGVPSPIEQNKRHIAIFERMIESGGISLPTRLGFTMKPTLHSAILVSKGARISRPKVEIPGLESVVKNDQLRKVLEAEIDKASAMSIAKSIAKMVSPETLDGIAHQILALHKPASFDYAAKFGLSGVPVVAAPVKQDKVPQPIEKAEKPVVAPAAPAAPAAAPSTEATPAEGKEKQKLVCVACTEPVAYNVAKFCWFNKPKFGGKVYCVDCQKKV